jgi:hypothetical protein
MSVSGSTGAGPVSVPSGAAGVAEIGDLGHGPVDDRGDHVDAVL